MIYPLSTARLRQMPQMNTDVRIRITPGG